MMGDRQDRHTALAFAAPPIVVPPLPRIIFSGFCGARAAPQGRRGAPLQWMSTGHPLDKTGLMFRGARNTLISLLLPGKCRDSPGAPRDSYGAPSDSYGAPRDSYGAPAGFPSMGGRPSVNLSGAYSSTDHPTEAISASAFRALVRC